MRSAEALLSVRGLHVIHGQGLRQSEVLRGVSFDIAAGTTVGLVGESGSGKSTLAKTVVGIHRAAAGEMLFSGQDISQFRGRARTRLLRQIQLIPQDPYSSLDPLRTIGQTLAEALEPKRASMRAHGRQVAALLEQVSLPAHWHGRYPAELSGGQRQRVAIARALAAEPQLIIADEITSALDLSTQAEILQLFDRLRRELRLAVLFVSHNLAVVRQLSDEVIVLLRGQLVDRGEAATLFSDPKHPYTRQLVNSVPGSPGFSVD